MLISEKFRIKNGVRLGGHIRGGWPKSLALPALKYGKNKHAQWAKPVLAPYLSSILYI